jgi:hypothetical protein
MAYEINAGAVEGMFTTGEPSLGGITGFTALRIREFALRPSALRLYGSPGMNVEASIRILPRRHISLVTLHH